MGFAAAWPSAAYELVMESITDWAFSCPISVLFQQKKYQLAIRFRMDQGAGISYVDNTPTRSSDDSFPHYAPCARSSSRA